MVDDKLKTTNPILYRKQYIEDFASQAGMTPIEKAAFMARIDHETEGFKYMVEIGNAAYFAQYDTMKQLGNTLPGDGFKFRGRGYVQLTGRWNYTRYAPFVGADIVNYPDLAAEESVAARIAITFWNKTIIPGGYTIAQAAQAGDIDSVVRGVNGGTNGLAQTKALFEVYKKKYLPPVSNS